MSNFEDGSYGSVTGLTLLGKVLAGRCSMKYTKAAVGNGTIPDGKTPKTMTGPAGYVMDAKIASITNPVNGECQVTLQIRSDDVETGFYATNIVLYAEDPDEGDVPYTYLSLENEPEWIRPASSIVGKLATFDLIAAVGDVDAVTAIIDPEAVATVACVEELIERHNTADDSHEELVAKVQEALTKLITITFDSQFVGKTYTFTGGGDAAKTGTVPDNKKITIAVEKNAEYTISVTVDGKTYSNSVTTEQYGKDYSLSLEYINVYGASWDGGSGTAWTRTGTAKNFTDPVPYVAGASNYGSPFDDLQPWAGMVKKTRNGNVMVAIPKFWYKLTQNGAGLSVEIADREKDGFSVAPAHADRKDGKGERDIAYVGRYHCGQSYTSVTGEKPKANITRATARTEIHKLGDNIWQSDFAMRFTLWLLYIVEFANWNSQAKIGKGCGNNSSTENMGYTDSMPYHTGTMLSSRDTYGVGTQYRNIEGLWDNVLDWCDGCYYDSKGLNIIMDPYDYGESGGLLVGLPSNGYPSKFSVSDKGGFPMFYPVAASGSETTYSCDGWYYYASGPCLCVGGDYGQGGYRGLFCVGCNTASNSYPYVGCRLQELP